MNKLYEAKRKIVEAGQSRIFADWTKHSTITKEEFLDGVKWLCEDPKENGRATRQLCLKPDGLVKQKGCTTTSECAQFT